MSSVELIHFPRDTLEVLADLTVRLVKLRQDECKHLLIENMAPDLWANLLHATYPPIRMMLDASGEISPFLGDVTSSD